MAREKLTPKQAKFIEEYMVDLNATQAAIRAGYSAKTANRTATKLLSKSVIQAAIQAKRKVLSERTMITAERVLREYARIAFADQRAFIEWGPDGLRLKASADLSDDDAAAVMEVTETVTNAGGSMRFKLHDKKGALDALAKHLKLFDDGIDVNILNTIRLPRKSTSSEAWQQAHRNGHSEVPEHAD